MICTYIQGTCKPTPYLHYILKKLCPLEDFSRFAGQCCSQNNMNLTFLSPTYYHGSPPWLYNDVADPCSFLTHISLYSTISRHHSYSYTCHTLPSATPFPIKRYDILAHKSPYTTPWATPSPTSPMPHPLINPVPHLLQ